MMHMIDSLNEKILEETILLLGNFDGFHKGHQKLLNLAKKIKKETNCKILIFSFNKNTKLENKQKFHYLMSENQKILLLKKFGVDYFASIPFDEDIKNMEALDFLDKMLYNFSVRHIILSSNHRFGKNRTGDINFLNKYSKIKKYKVYEVEMLKVEDYIVSSTNIRKLIKSGDMIKANMMLGNDFELEGKLINGKNLGNKRGFPTINLELTTEYVCPKKGVYASKILINNKWYLSITNIGVNPTFNQKGVHIETYVLEDGFEEVKIDGMIYLRLYNFIREEKHFDSIDLLYRQVESDVKSVKKLYDIL